MSRRETLLRREQLEYCVIVIDRYLSSLNENESNEIEKTIEYIVLKKLIYGISALNVTLKNCV